MQFTLEKVTTTDNYILHGLLSEPKEKSKTIIIHMHGSAGNCYQSNFYPHIYKMANQLNIAFLSTNSRGTGVYDVEGGVKYRGAAIEMFEECLLDIDAWIEIALKKGYDNIILEGHSFGTNKIQYYILNGKYKENIKALILLGFTDSYEGQLEYLKSVGIKNDQVLKEARQLISENKPYQLLSYWLINWGELPQSAQSYNNFMSSGSELSKILPLKESELSNFRKINKPILGIVGDRDECTVIPPKAAVDLLNNENENAKCYMIENCNHLYEGREDKLITIIKSFIQELSKLT